MKSVFFIIYILYICVCTFHSHQFYHYYFYSVYFYQYLYVLLLLSLSISTLFILYYYFPISNSICIIDYFTFWITNLSDCRRSIIAKNFYDIRLQLSSVQFACSSTGFVFSLVLFLSLSLYLSVSGVLLTYIHFKDIRARDLSTNYP